MGTSPQMWGVERLLQDAQLSRPHHLQLQAPSHQHPQLCSNTVDILTFSMALSSPAVTHQIILKCILFRVLSQLNENTFTYLYLHITQMQINSNTVRSQTQS